MKKDTFYFPHDYNARNDEKIKKLIRKHGMTGYGIYWSLVEDLYNNANALQMDCDGIAYDLRTDKDIIKSIINDFDLFEIENDYFGSLSITRRLDERNNKSTKARQSAYKRWGKMQTQSECNADAMQTQSECNAIKEKKVKEIKEIKEIKLKEIKVNNKFIIPQISEIQKYLEEEKNIHTDVSLKIADNFFNFYDSKGWKIGKVAMEKWKSALARSLKWEENQSLIIKYNQKNKTDEQRRLENEEIIRMAGI